MLYNPSEILAVENGPMMDLVDIQTSTGTFFAAGLATHNCFKKRGGCGAKFRDGDEQIESQQAGRVFNPDIADQVNTIQKMSQKRSLVAAVLLAVNASEFFTQDIEDLHASPAPINASVVHDVTNAPPAAAPDPDAEIRAACRALGKSEAQLNGWIEKKFGAPGVAELTADDKAEVLSLLKGMLMKKAAA